MKLNRRNTTALLVATAITTSGQALAARKISDETGLGGFVTVGLSSTSFSSNMISGSDFGDVGNDKIDSIDKSPDSETLTSGFFTGEINYTFAETRTQLFLGNSLEDLIRYDFGFQAGVRQEVSDNGIVSASVLFSGLPTNVWEDPYVTGEKRKETERESNGGRIAWSDVMGTGLEVRLSHRTLEIDDELSGMSPIAEGGLGLTATESELLSREGDQLTFEASYWFDLGNGHKLTPKITYDQFDLDGDARSRDRIGAQLAYGYFSGRYSLVTTATYARADYDETNPIYIKTEEVDSYGVTLVGGYHQPFGLKGWSAIATAAYIESDSNIDFYDAEIAMLTLGMLYKF